MSKTRTRRPASHPRSARRSLVDLTAAASRAIGDDLYVPSGSGISAFPDGPVQSEHGAETSGHTIVAKQGTAPSPIAGPEFANPAVPRNGEPADSNSTAEMMVKIAKDYQNQAFENIKVSLNAALDHTKDFAETRVGSDAASKDRGGSSPGSNFLTILKGAATEFRAEALELMKANMVTNLQYARELAGTTTMAEFVELSSAQARKQCELILRQAGALKSFAQTITKPSAD
jgi:hypothetical protein